MDRSRSAKTSANKLIKRTMKNVKKTDGERVQKTCIQTKKSDKRKSVVRVDPWVPAAKKTIGDYYGSSSASKHETVERGARNFQCYWRSGKRSICGISVDSMDDLMQHLLDVHSNGSSNICNWAKCPDLAMVKYPTKKHFQKHLRHHVYNVSRGVSDEAGVDCGKEAKAKDLQEDHGTDSDYQDSSDEELNGSKRRGRKRKLSFPIQSKRVRSESLEVTEKDCNTLPAAQTQNPVAHSPNTVKVSPVQLSFYRFKCMWVVPYDLGKKGKTPSTPAPSITCMRKFTVLEESLQHLVGHHIDRIRNTKPRQPIKCQWKDCSANDREFVTIEDLIEHVKVHTPENVTPVHNSGRPPSAASDSPSKVLRSPPPVNKTPETTLARVTAAKNSPSATNTESDNVPSSSPLGKCSDVLKSEEENGLSLSWMSSVLHALMTTRLSLSNAGLCAVSPTCQYCHFVSLKNRNSHKDLVLLEDLYEFTLFADKYQKSDRICNPLSFMTALYDSIANDEELYHKSQNFLHTFWMKCLETDGPKCPSHPLEQNLINLFPSFYKSCSHCSKDAESWPRESQENLIIKLRTTETSSACIQYPDVMCMKDRVFQLSAVVGARCTTTAGVAYRVYVKIKNGWMCKDETSCDMATTNQVFNSKEACIIVYTAKHSLLERENSRSKSEIVSQWYELGDRQKGSELIADTPTEVMVAECITEGSPSKPCHSMIDTCSKTTSEDACSLDLKLSSKLTSAFIHRRIENKGNESCIISVLQALLQTTVAVASPEMCRSTRQCYFCNMLSFSRRILSDRTGDGIPAYEFTLYREDFDLGAKEGDPGVYISDLIGEIVNCERTNHHTSEAKYKFMIRLQRKSCSCMLSCGMYHWPVFPERRNECLLHLMMKYKTLCTQCNVMTHVQPIQMPDNLIITMQENERNPDASVHYPDEWGSHNIRYNLAAVVARDPTVSGECHHYLAYCKVFGKWMCYDDDVVKTVSPSDVLGNKYACVLVYVANELTANELQSVLADAQAYRFKDVHDARLRIKEEKGDW